MKKLLIIFLLVLVTASVSSSGDRIIFMGGSGSGTGDMAKTTYDTDSNNVVDTATALAANGANCNAGYAPRGVDASGAVENCTQYQAYDADLTTYAGITPSADVQTLLGSADNSAMRTNLGLAIGTNVQAQNSSLGTIATGSGADCLYGENASSSFGCYSSFNMRSAEVIKIDSATLTLAEVSGTILSNYGEEDDEDLILTLPDLDAYPGANFVYKIAAAMATNDTCVKAAADNAFRLDGTAGADNGCICNAAPALGNKLACIVTTIGASAVEIDCESTRGTWALVADNTGDCPN